MSTATMIIASGAFFFMHDVRVNLCLVLYGADRSTL